MDTLSSAPRAVRLGFWRYARHWLVLWAMPWAVIGVFELREPYTGSKLALGVAFVGAAIIIGCALSFAMWAGSRLVWHHGGNVGRWVAARHMYGPRADD